MKIESFGQPMYRITIQRSLLRSLLTCSAFHYDAVCRSYSLRIGEFLADWLGPFPTRQSIQNRDFLKACFPGFVKTLPNRKIDNLIKESGWEDPAQALHASSTGQTLRNVPAMNPWDRTGSRKLQQISHIWNPGFTHTGRYTARALAPGVEPVSAYARSCLLFKVL